MSAGTLLDLALVVLLVAYTVSGFRQGFVLGALSLLGFLGAGFVAMALLPELVGNLAPGLGRVVLVLGGVLLAAWAGQSLGVLVGRALRERFTWEPVRALDSALGAVAALLAVALLTWFVAGALRASPAPTLARAVASSKVVAVVDSVVPNGATQIFSGFRQALEAGAFPRVFDGLAPEQILPVEPPDPAEVGEAAAAAAGGIVKVTGVAEECSRGQEGTGWVVAPQRVVTNAHVVAGVSEPLVQVTGQGERLQGEVVLFDAARDLAVIAVPDLEAAPLALGGDLEAGQPAAVAGFPLNGPYQSSPARVRQVIDARGEDIYGRPGVVREVYSLFADVEPGNSGGPLLDPSGAVVGVIFAKSLDDGDTGYALTLDESQEVIDAAASASDPVPVGPCTTG